MNDFFTGGFGGLASGLLGSIGSIWQNKTNLKIARETNAMNRQMFDDQLAYNTDMWNKQNEYNDPYAQRQRLEQAGLNPLFHGLDGTGNATGWQTATPIPAQGTSVVNPLQSLGVGVGDMINQQKTASERDLNNAKTITENAMRTGLVEGQHMQIRLWSGQVELTATQEKQLERSIDQMDKQLEIMQGTLDNAKAMTAIAQQNANTEEFKAKVMAADTRSQIEKRNHEIKNIDANTWAVGQQIALAFAHLAVDQQNANTNSRMADIAQQNANINQQNADINQQNANINQQNADTASAAQKSQDAVNQSIIHVNDADYELKVTMNEKGKKEIQLVDAQIETEKSRKKNIDVDTDLKTVQTVNEGIKAANAILEFFVPDLL